MKTLKQVSWSILILFTIVISGCKHDKDDPVAEDSVLVSYEKVTSLSSTVIQLAIASMESSYPDADGLSELVKSGVNVYKITYKTSFAGDELVASGLVAIPSVSGNFPLLSFQNGTNVLYSDAPSNNYALDLTDPENTTVVLESMASLGFVVAIPDYPGFGSSESVFHPYLEKANTLPSMTDMIIAAKELLAKTEIEAKLNKDLFLAGYSQGGWSTAQLLKSIDQSPLDDFTLKAASCGAGPYDLSEMNSYVLGLESYPMPYYFGYLLQAYSLHGLIDNPLSDMFADEYAAKIPSLFNFTTSGGEINAQLTDNISELFKADYISGYASDSKFASVKTALQANSITAWNLQTPTKLFHGDADVYIPISISEHFLADFRSLGVGEDMISLTSIEGADHSGGVLPFGMQTIKWFLSFEN